MNNSDAIEPVPEIHYRGTFDVKLILDKLVRNVTSQQKTFLLKIDLDVPHYQLPQLVTEINQTTRFGLCESQHFRLTHFTTHTAMSFKLFFTRGIERTLNRGASEKYKFGAELTRDEVSHLRLINFEFVKNHSCQANTLGLPESNGAQNVELVKLTDWIQNSGPQSSIWIDVPKSDLAGLLEVYIIGQSFPRYEIACYRSDDIDTKSEFITIRIDNLRIPRGKVYYEGLDTCLQLTGVVIAMIVLLIALTGLGVIVPK